MMENTSFNFISFSFLLVIYFAVCFVGSFSEDPEVHNENIKKLATANNDFALKIYHRLATGSSDNVFFSPLSLSAAFGMLYYGTKGETAKELRNVLGYETADLSDEILHQTFHAYLTESLPSNNSSDYTMKIANAILFDKHLKMVSTYIRKVRHFYQASVKGVNFMSEYAHLLHDVNCWVSEMTDGKIDKLVEDLDIRTTFMILNAVYFKGTWEQPFESNMTSPVTFFNNGLESESKKVPMMTKTEILLYNDEFGVEAFELPYKGENIRMIVLLPDDRDGLYSLEENLTLDEFSSIRQRMKKTEVELTFPKFKLQYSRKMKSDFEFLGAKEIFNPEANFSGITSDDVSVNEIMHKAMLVVNEEGSEASAVSGVSMEQLTDETIENVEVVADHPFIFAIVDTTNDMILFLGRVSNL